MENYLPDLNNFFVFFKNNDSRIELSKSIPPVCPFLLHTALPYIFVFQNKGRFPWMELNENPQSVFVQCPNPAGSVVLKLEYDDRNITGIIHSRKGTCFYGHNKDTSFKLNPDKELKIPLTVFDSIFPWMTYLSRLNSAENLRSPELSAYLPQGETSFYLARLLNSGLLKKPEERACTVLKNEGKPAVKLSNYAYRCRYHKWPRREHYNWNNFVPRGMCPDLFHNAYIYCMNTLYGGINAENLIVRCPDARANIRLKIVKKKMKTFTIRKLASNLLRKLGKNTEIPDHNCYLILETASADCPMKMVKGSSFTFNLGNKYELCPAAFDNIFFMLHNVARGLTPPWQSYPPEKGIVQCPDSESKITFNIE